jgi:hypothetical protein|tara:strand:- start:520 stop:831 length:312 start_codon:yes stop_codon:yes gene_type:complete
MKYKIKLLKSDIANGISGDNFNCPISLCLKRKFKAKKVYIDIGFLGVFMIVDGIRYSVIDKYLDKVENFMSKFDSYFEDQQYHIYDARVLRPISFEITKNKEH